VAQLKDKMTPFLTATEIDDLVAKLAKEIERDYRDEELIVICPLKGSVMFVADLMRKIRLPQIVDFVSVSNEPIRGEPDSSGTVRILKDISVNIAGKHVLICEEIIDVGRTLSFLKNRLLASNPASLKIVTLLDKPARRAVPLKPDYIGRTIEDRYVVGYGLDDSELGRNYSQLYLLKN
jgi:hypoxanthine phosphoribosyltransferase